AAEPKAFCDCKPARGTSRESLTRAMTCRTITLDDITQDVISRGGAAVSPGLSDLGRFSEPALLVLISLAGGPKHGYAMIEDIATIGGSRLGPGTLYGAIARLEKLGLIEPLLPTDRRRPYRLST